MSRPQAFDTDATIEAAMDVFWDRGLHRTSVDDLLAASGLARSSLYNSFGGKQVMFERAVERYVDQQVATLQKMLEGRSLREGLETLFERAVNDNYRGRGCLLVNCASGLMTGDAKEQDLLRKGFERMFAVLGQRIRLAQQTNEVVNYPAEDIAMLICSTLSGLRIFHKTGMPKKKLRSAARLALDGLLRQVA